MQNIPNQNKESMQKNGGIIFFKTTNIEDLHKFYTGIVGATLWLDQGGCRIYKFGNLLFGFCQRDSIDNGALLTFCYPDKKSVEKMYARLSYAAQAAPVDNDDYRIYHFYAEDPDGRSIEFQYFWDAIE